MPSYVDSSFEGAESAGPRACLGPWAGADDAALFGVALLVAAFFVGGLGVAAFFGVSLLVAAFFVAALVGVAVFVAAVFVAAVFVAAVFVAAFFVAAFTAGFAATDPLPAEEDAGPAVIVLAVAATVVDALVATLMVTALVAAFVVAALLDADLVRPGFTGAAGLAAGFGFADLSG